MKRQRLTFIASCAASAALVAGLVLTDGACGQSVPQVKVKRIEARHELIGGPRALGEVGDWLLENDKIRIIVQDAGFSRGFGVFGGALIDADLVRTGSTEGNARGGLGNDNFGELFPSFFLEALEPTEVNNPLRVRCRADADCAEGETCIPPEDDPDGDPESCTLDGNRVPRRLPPIEIEKDGSDGVAVLVVRGYGNDFLALTQTINETLLNDSREAPRLLFETRYTLRPGERYITMSTTVQNVAFPPEDQRFEGSFAGIEVPTPFGDVALFGAGNNVFLPHEAGYDLRFRLEERYDSGAFELPAFPGLVAEYIASSGPGVSYGILPTAPDDPEGNYSYSNRDQFEEATPHSLHVPFIASAFTGVFQVNPPDVLAANDNRPGGDDEFTFSRSFIIGNGDVASVTEVVHEILGDETGALVGEVLEGQTSAPVAGASVIVEDTDGNKVTQCTADDGGRFAARALRPGNYRLRVVDRGRTTTAPVDVSVTANNTTHQTLNVGARGRVVVTVLEEGVGRIPAKVSVVGTVSGDQIGQDPKVSLSDLSVGEPYRFSDFLTDDPDDVDTLKFIEDFGYTDNGTVSLTVRPGTYEIYASRGIEYSRARLGNVVVTEGAVKTMTLTIAREVQTPGYIGADFHLHTAASLDSDHPIDEAIVGYAAEGVEFAVSTDHNFVVDYEPVIERLGLDRFIQSAVGLELTTIDRGHFNGFPLQQDDGALVSEEALADGGTPTYGRSNPVTSLGATLDGLTAEEQLFPQYINTISARTRGSFQWASRNPQDIFDDLRARGRISPACLAENGGDKSACDGARGDVIVQVNHPRDSILGYFDQYGVNADTLEVEGQEGLFAPNTDQHREFRPERFSWDFDAIEVFNGKRYEYLHSYRVPEGVDIDPVSCCPVTAGEVLRDRPALDCDPELRDCTCTADDTDAQVASGICDREADVAYPGVIEDWFAMLQTGLRTVGTANSDSHEPHKEEPGYPRTYVRVPSDRPIDVTPSDITAGLQSGDALMTNGPFIELELASGAGTAKMGQTLTAEGGTVEVHIKGQTASWMGVNVANIYVNGELARSLSLSSNAAGVSNFDDVVEVPVAEDGFVVVEVIGETSLFPTVFPNEIKPLQFTDVLGSIGGAFGLAPPEGALEPALTGITTPFAITNPVWVDADGDGEVTPTRVLPGQEEAEERLAAQGQGLADGTTTSALPEVPMTSEAQRQQAQAAQRKALKDYFWQSSRRKRDLLRRVPPYLWPTAEAADIRNVYFQFLKHSH